MCSTHTGKHHKAADSPGQAAYDLALISMELLALKREEKRKQLSQGKMEKWLEDITAKTTPVVELPEGGVFIPNYSRNVTVRFEDPEVRKRLKSLINTDVVKVLDKDFMCNLQNKLYQSYWTAFEERLADRRKWESQRRKVLALDGVQPLDDNSLDKHPIVQVRNEVEKTFEIMKKKTEKPYQTRKRMICDYKQFNVPLSEESVASSLEESESENIVDFSEIDKKKKNLDVKMDPSYTTLLSQDFYQRIKYEPPLVKDLRAAHSVKDLYEIAEKILDQHELHPPPLTEDMIKTGLKVDQRNPAPEHAER